MRNPCYKTQRAAEFRKKRFVSHVPKGRLAVPRVQSCIEKFVNYFENLRASAGHGELSSGSKGSLRVTKPRNDYRVEYSGNSQNGQIVVRGGHSLYAEINYSPRAIHVYRAESISGSLNDEAAVYLDRALPKQSLSFGSTRQLERLISGT